MLFLGVTVFAMGLLLGLDPLVAQAFGARRLDECHRWLVDGIWLGIVVTLPMVGVIYAMNLTMPMWGLPTEVVALSQPYLAIVTWSLPPLLMYVAFRRYLQAMNIVRPIMFVLLAANVVNAIVNWVLINGLWGAPAMGVRGAAYATLSARIFMAGCLLMVIVRHEARRPPALSGVEGRLRDTPPGIDVARLRRLFWLGFPAAGQMVFEVGVFTAATALVARVSAEALAAHQIALNLASFTFMIPLGVASAAAVRVGQAIGRGDPRGAAGAGWAAISIAVGFMGSAAIVFFTMPRALIHLFTPDPAVLELGVSLLFVAAVFQLFDGVQGVITGVLRGLADTRTAMLWNLLGHWAIGLPLGYWICFRWGYGVVGLWWGLSAGLMICAVALLSVWIREGTRLAGIREGEPING
jgi:MATE family multidrug resistance protein